jgi:hypothetical protein
LEDKIEAQRKKIKDGNPVLDLIGPCKVDDGIFQIRDTEKDALIEKFETEREHLDVSFFVPASGSGSRMFSALFEVAQSEDPSESSVEFVESFIDRIEYLPFFDAELAKLKEAYRDGRAQRKTVLNYVLDKNKEHGLNLGNMPKGLIPFHSYEEFILNPFQEHLVQGTEIAGEAAAFHFTINAQFENEIKEELDAVGKHHGTTFRFSFSEQNPNGNSIAFDKNLEPVILKNGEILTRPAGHGALINNLNALEADIVFIRNIDNMQHYRKAETSLKTRKMLAGVLLELRDQVNNVLSKIERSHAFESSLKTLNEKYDLRLSEKQLLDSTHAYQALNRPIRICGMVKNEGQPGGGPFWVRDEEGNPKRQIVEKSQIIDNPDQVKLMDYATHFNPVELFCSVRNYKGEKFNLHDFVNSDHYFVVNKTHQGDDIVYIEQPGLWNGAMDKWITVFYEIESNCFSPVKTVLDLLKPAHQA